MESAIGAALGAFQPNTAQWVMVIHIFGFIMWVGMLVSMYQILFAHQKAEAASRNAFADLERGISNAMDVGAGIAMLGGIYTLVRATPSPMKQGYMHVKLTLVVLLIGAHVFARIKARKFRDGEVKPIPEAIFPVILLIVLSIIILVIVKPL